MPIYFFHMLDSDRLIRDREGAFFVDVEAAASEVRVSAREWALHLIKSGKKIADQSIEMADEMALSASHSRSGSSSTEGYELVPKVMGIEGTDGHDPPF